MTGPDLIQQLVQRFDEHRAAYRSGEYNEAQARREFIDPFFEALGWDVFNKQGYAEAYKDVIHEDAIKVGGATKAPDYAFRIGGTRHRVLWAAPGAGQRRVRARGRAHALFAQAARRRQNPHRKDPSPAPDRCHRLGDRPAGVRAVRADEGGDQDRGGKLKSM